MHKKPVAFNPETETMEAVGRYSFIQKKRGNRYTGDSVRLVDFMLESGVKGPRLIDLGTGAAFMPVYIASKLNEVEITGVEIISEYAELANRNVLLNGLSDRIRILTCDYRSLPGSFESGSFDVVISNPPYVKAGAGRQSPDPSRRIGRSEAADGLKDLLAVSSYLAAEDARLFFVFPVIRKAEMLEGMDAVGLRLDRILDESVEAGKRAKVFFVEASRMA